MARTCYSKLVSGEQFTGTCTSRPSNTNDGAVCVTDFIHHMLALLDF